MSIAHPISLLAILALLACGGTTQAKSSPASPTGRAPVDSATAVAIAHKAAVERRPEGEKQRGYDVVGFVRERGAIRVTLRLKSASDEVIVGGGAVVRLTEAGDLLSVEYLQ